MGKQKEKEQATSRNMPPSSLYEVEDDDGLTHSNHDSDSVQNDALQIGQNENRAVTRSQIILGVVLLGVAAAVSTAVFIFGRSNELDDFENQFQMHASKVIDDIMTTTAKTLRAIDGFGIQITMHALDHGMKWPNVAITDFETRARITMDLAEAISLIFIPIVYEEQRLLYEKFTIANQDWLKHGLAEQTLISHGPLEERSIETLIDTYGHDQNLSIPKKIFKITGLGIMEDDGPAPYAPIWQFAPAFPVPSIVNLNTFSLPSREEELRSIIRKGRTVVGRAIDYSKGESNTGRGSVLNLFLNRGSSATNYVGGPVSDLYSPIFDKLGSLDTLLHTNTTYQTSLSAATAKTSNENGGRQIVGLLTSYVYWQHFFENHLPENVKGMIAVLENNCDQIYTFELNGPKVTYLGEGDLHESKYDSLEMSTGFGGVFLQDVNDLESGQCLVNVHMYPSTIMENTFKSKIPALFTIVIVSTFLFTSIVFIWYQRLVERRNSVVMKAAVQSTAVVQSLFPANVRERLFEENQQQEKQAVIGKTIQSVEDALLNGGIIDGDKVSKEERKKTSSILTSETIFGSKPIADLFANTTVMFADMVGFTAWASVREPTQVFTLLETIYHSFDMSAKRMRVFKVETVGDCYVAVAGLPTPRKDHAIVMAKFATQCLSKMDELCQELEKSLGPDTAELGLRIGLHSGPVTAGVLRGDKGRFQLFGDTMNTASRMETTGVNGKIHLSRDTGDLLISAGKESWITAREEKVIAKGKGEMQTYWLHVKTDSLPTGSTRSDSEGNVHGDGDNIRRRSSGRLSANSSHSEEGKKNPNNANGTTSNGASAYKNGAAGSNATRKNSMNSNKNVSNSVEAAKKKNAAKTQRLVQWNVDVLSRLLTQIVARRRAASFTETSNHNGGGALGMLGIKYNRVSSTTDDHASLSLVSGPGKTVLDEVVDIVALPKFNPEVYKQQKDIDNIKLSALVTNQLSDYVTQIASMYQNNPFHNFEHASHVTMSVTKLLSRIVNPVEVIANNRDNNIDTIASNLHDHTFGITSDPLTQFACVFSALIHDLDHPGVTNTVLVEEKRPEAIKYKNKSVAEQKSVDLAWEYLMDPKYEELRCCIYDTHDELSRFRQLVVNVVMATDIMDKDLGALRKARWEKAFREGACDKNEDDINRKATIVIEHLIQASDVAHTMQHWHVYRKWNERLFHEMYRAFKAGRIEKDPSEFWYNGEIGFFDFYIVPLAKKLETCGVFGVSSDEYLNYALANRREWEERGAEIVKGYVESYAKMYGE